MALRNSKTHLTALAACIWVDRVALCITCYMETTLSTFPPSTGRAWRVAPSYLPHRSRRTICQPRLSPRPPPNRASTTHAPRRTLLRQRLHGVLFRSHQDRTRNDQIPRQPTARLDIASYIAFYNHDPRYSSLNYLAPAAFEAQLNHSI